MYIAIHIFFTFMRFKLGLHSVGGRGVRRCVRAKIEVALERLG